MSNITKPSNPKEAFGELKMVDGLVPETAIVEENLAFLEGALKYGQYNWRVAGVKASTYRRAIGRHLKKWWNGQDRDPATLVLELASVRACCGIMIDAIACGKFTDDRPPRADMEKVLADAAKVAAHLKELFKDHAPPYYTQQLVDEQVNTVAVPAGTELRDLVGAALAAGGRVDVQLVDADPAQCPYVSNIVNRPCSKMKGHKGPHFVLAERVSRKLKKKSRR
jgi:hypothetical protein